MQHSCYYTMQPLAAEAPEKCMCVGGGGGGEGVPTKNGIFHDGLHLYISSSQCFLLLQYLNPCK